MLWQSSPAVPETTMRLIRFPALLLALAASACHADPNEEAVQCPRAYVLPEASHVSHFDGRGTDISDLVLGARLTDVQGACSGKLGVREEGAHGHVVMVVTKGPAATSNEADVGYILGVVRDGQILDKAAYVQHVTFPPNVSNLEVTGQEIALKLPTGKGVSGPNYHLYFMLNLTPEELAANRRQ